MLPICHVCLRTDKKLQILDESLLNFHDELCDYAIESFAQFCSECSYLLQKFQNFKTKCVQAVEILNSWRELNSKVKVPLNSLSEQLPPSSLGFCIKKNHEEFCYEGQILKSELTHAYNIEHSIDNTSVCEPSTHTQTKKTAFVDTAHIDKYSNTNITSVNTEDTSKEDFQIYDTTNLVKEIKIEYDFVNENAESQEPFESVPVKNDIDSERNSDNESSDFNLDELLKDVDSTVSSDDDGEVKPNTSKSGNKISDKDKPLKKRKRRKTNRFNIDQLRHTLKIKFAKSGEVKDEDGNIIDQDCILDSLDKMHVYTLNQIGNRCAGTSVFTPDAIKVLSRVQKTYGNQYSSVFNIEHLSTKELVLEEFEKRQHYEVYVSSEHKCTLCYRGFKHKKLLEYHEKTYHDPCLPHCCPVCQMRFKSRHALIKHRAWHRAVYKCKLCPLITSYRTAMVNHYHQHKGVVYVCELCKCTFKSKSCLSAHMNYVHQSQYICSLCARTFASETGLAQHRTRKHSNEEPIETANSKKCDTCNVTFVSIEVYDKHIIKSHAETITHGYVYRKRNVGPRQRPNFVCRVCNAVEHSIGRLMWHFKREHPTANYEQLYSDLHKYLCHICGKGYTSITSLNEHKHLHTGAKPYACDKCPKAFHRKINLRNHLQRHLPPARECQHCGKKFVSAANLSNHIKMHIGIRHHVCEICSKSFLHKSSLNAHVRGVHHHIRRERKPALKPID